MRVEIKDMMFMIKLDKSVRGLNELKDCFLTVNETQWKRMKYREFCEKTIRNHMKLILSLRGNHERVEFIL